MWNMAPQSCDEDRIVKARGRYTGGDRGGPMPITQMLFQTTYCRSGKTDHTWCAQEHFGTRKSICGCAHVCKQNSARPSFDENGRIIARI
jgi:hypothetical protein